MKSLFLSRSKLEAVRLIMEEGYTQTEAARIIGINAKMLGRWVREHQRDEGETLEGNGKPALD